MSPRLELPRASDAIRAVLQQQPVLAAYIFGSYARQTADAESDIDIGIVPLESLSADERFDLTIQLMVSIASALRVPIEMVDVVDLRQASVVLQWSAISEGVPVAGEGTKAKAEFDRQVEQRYKRAEPELDREEAALFRRILSHA